jgi:CheY-like chemotaxis protein
MLGHELRNPLGAIASAAAVLDAAGQPDDRTVRAQQVIARQVQHLARMMDDLLDVGRVTTGKIALDRRPMDLAEVARRSVGALAEIGTTGGHRVEVETAPVWVHGDETRLDQVITNLVENAAKYTPPGGAIRVSVRADGDAARLRVEDTGMGIPRDLLPRLFNLFVQGERSLDRAQGGLGIGLTLVRRLVELHGGRVHAASPRPSRGSVFTVWLPGVAPPAAPAHLPAAPSPIARRRILVVEDHADAREMLRQLLVAEGHEVHEAADGAEGVRAAVALRPDVAIVDVGLPGVDGYGVAAAIRADPDTTGTFLVALTGYGRAEDRQRALEAGFDAHLVKPVDLEALARVLAVPIPRAEAR